MIREININDEEKYYELGSLLNNQFAKLFDLNKTLLSKYNKIYVYVMDDVTVGFIHIQISFDVADLVNIVVDANYRRKHVASALLNYAIKENNIKEINLEVATKNNALYFYQSEGFKIIRTIHHYYEDDDAFLMKKVNK